jgi:hypothetical protein
MPRDLLHIVTRAIGKPQTPDWSLPPQMDHWMLHHGSGSRVSATQYK